MLLVAALAISIGLHWAVLQSVAWVGMVVNYSQSAPLAVALARTFDGRHPCKLCKLVNEGKKSEKSQELQKPAAKIDFFLSQNPVTIFPPVLAPQPIARRLRADVGDPRATPPALRDFARSC